mgnify:CR=1 FL=1
MLEKIEVNKIIFLDIETVPLTYNFNELDKVISYVSKKFNVNNSHPFIINSSIRLVK